MAWDIHEALRFALTVERDENEDEYEWAERRDVASFYARFEEHGVRMGFRSPGVILDPRERPELVAVTYAKTAKLLVDLLNTLEIERDHFPYESNPWRVFERIVPHVAGRFRLKGTRLLGLRVEDEVGEVWVRPVYTPRQVAPVITRLLNAAEAAGQEVSGPYRGGQ